MHEPMTRAQALQLAQATVMEAILRPSATLDNDFVKRMRGAQK